MVIIVGFNVGGAWMGIEWCDWFGRWVNGGRVGLQCVALVGFVVGMAVGTLGVGACWDLLLVCCIYC
jgi:hypothetical protein